MESEVNRLNRKLRECKRKAEVIVDKVELTVPDEHSRCRNTLTYIWKKHVLNKRYRIISRKKRTFYKFLPKDDALRLKYNAGAPKCTVLMSIAKTQLFMLMMCQRKPFTFRTIRLKQVHDTQVIPEDEQNDTYMHLADYNSTGDWQQHQGFTIPLSKGISLAIVCVGAVGLLAIGVALGYSMALMLHRNAASKPIFSTSRSKKAVPAALAKSNDQEVGITSPEHLVGEKKQPLPATSAQTSKVDEPNAATANDKLSKQCLDEDQMDENTYANVELAGETKVTNVQ
ncbi:unnamed protein product [Toxocara canis]|uniref:CUB domain-containing protein n=1 Tax=Toxocara canis TaxID=6265 RepID=A0A183TW65_TOXCA|nr:unnamed protein product [Toxocara canis]